MERQPENPYAFTSLHKRAAWSIASYNEVWRTRCSREQKMAARKIVNLARIPPWRKWHLMYDKQVLYHWKTSDLRQVSSSILGWHLEP